MMLELYRNPASSKMSSAQRLPLPIEKLAARKLIGKGVGAYTKLLKDYAESTYATEAMLRVNECVEEIRRLREQAGRSGLDRPTSDADLAFQTLLQVRNKLVSAYDEIKQMRV